jgi:hypothetical protein
MPRRKASQQSLGEVLGVRIPPEDQARVLATFDGLPPVKYWVSIETGDQKELFSDVKWFYQALKTELELFFSGQGSNIPSLPEKDRGAMGAMVDKHLAWYAVVQRGWQYIEKDLADEGCSLSENGISSPSDALIDHLNRECALGMSEGWLPYYRFSPSAERKFKKLEIEISMGDHTPKKINRYNSIAKRNSQEANPYMSFSWKIIQICEDHSKHDRSLPRLLKAYKVAQGNVERESAWMLHERQKMKGVEWNRGVKQPLVQG